MAYHKFFTLLQKHLLLEILKATVQVFPCSSYIITLILIKTYFTKCLQCVFELCSINSISLP